MIILTLARGPLSEVANWVTQIIHSLGYWGVAILAGLENLFPPIPSELVLPLAGFLAGQGRFNLLTVVIAATLGSLAGAAILYALGRWIGDERLQAFVRDHGRWLMMDEDDLTKAHDWFDKHGGKAVLIGRLVPGFRSIISVPAGINRMSIVSFTLFTVLGSLIWNAALVLLGWFLGSNWTVVENYGQYLEYGVIAVLVGGAAWWVKRRWSRKGPGASQDQATNSS